MGRDTSRRMTSTWTAERLRDCVAEGCGGQPLVVLANREPLRHEWGPDGEPLAIRSAGGGVTALEPPLSPCRGGLVAPGGGGAGPPAGTPRDGRGGPPGP